MRTKDNFTRNEKEEIIDETGETGLHADDLKLIRLIRSIHCGEIERVKIKEGKVVSYKTAWKLGRLIYQ